MPRNEHPPSIRETAFECPHCGAYTTQYWFDLFAKARENNSTPFFPDNEFKKEVLKDPDERYKQHMLNWFENIESGLIFLEKTDDYSKDKIYNLSLSKCYRCEKFSVWVHENLVFPTVKQEVQPNPDLPDDITRDFEEARSIVGLSPRGAAALLRLCVQKICIHLGEDEGNINNAIKNLVSKGLNPLIQQSLDIIRVIGNEAVHPGTIDMNDDRDTANQLFGLINSIADQMISHPKSVSSLYEKLPEEKRKAIEDRNEKAKNK